MGVWATCPMIASYVIRSELLVAGVYPLAVLGYLIDTFVDPDYVVSISTINAISASVIFGEDHIIARATREEVATGSTHDRIVTRAAVNGVITRPAVESLGFRPESGLFVVATTATDVVTARPAVNEVSVTFAKESIGTTLTVYEVALGRADDLVSIRVIGAHEAGG